MTQEDKKLLLKGLCARLPYGVIVEDRNGTHVLSIGNTEFTDLFGGKCNIKPYLRPMSSMTEEDKEELAAVWGVDYIDNKVIDFGEFLCEGSPVNIEDVYGLLDWLNAHHFDYRGLIEKGLAIEVTEENNPYK